MKEWIRYSLVVFMTGVSSVFIGNVFTGLEGICLAVAFSFIMAFIAGVGVDLKDD